ncbi:MAG: uridine kinase [Fimbriimonadaceae bacterium]
MSTKPILIGIAGGSGSGKTFLAKQISSTIGSEHVGNLSMDSYFRGTTPMDNIDPRDINFDHPAHLDLRLMVTHLEALKRGESVRVPNYDFVTMQVSDGTTELPPPKVILVEGLFVLANPVLPLFDLTCFLDVEADQRLLGRIHRDIAERGGSTKNVVDRYQRFVRPSYRVFVEPTRQNADIIVDFTYRRSFFTQLLTHVIRDYVLSSLDLAAFVASVKADGFRSGLRPEEGAMPMMADILELAQNYPDSACPPMMVE